jgi:hypothetical protein
MLKEQTAILLVKKDWANSAAVLINEGKPSASSPIDMHMLIAPYDYSDERGVWLKECVSHQLTRDRSAVTMRVFVPWSVILSLGIVDEEIGKVQPGFPTQTASAM